MGERYLVCHKILPKEVISELGFEIKTQLIASQYERKGIPGILLFSHKGTDIDSEAHLEKTGA